MEKYLSPEEVCEQIPGMSVGLLKQMRFRGDGPPYVKVSSRRIAYAQSSLHAWMQSNERTSTRATA